MSITRQHYAKRISEKFNLTYAESRRIVDFFIDSIVHDLRDFKRVVFRGFGSFRTVIWPGHILHHEDKIIPVKPYKRCIFRSSKNLYKKAPVRRKKRKEGV